MGAGGSKAEDQQKEKTPSYPNQVIYTDAFLQSAGEESRQYEDGLEEPSAPQLDDSDDDDDYDITSMHVSTGMDGLGAADDEDAKPSSKELQARTFLTEAEKFQQVTDSMTQSMHEKTSDLIDKYPPTQRRDDVCDYARQAVYQCYQDHEDKLDCKDLVDSYKQCAERAVESRRKH